MDCRLQAALQEVDSVESQTRNIREQMEVADSRIIPSTQYEETPCEVHASMQAQLSEERQRARTLECWDTTTLECTIM